MMGDIGLIIDKFSMAYQDIYSHAEDGGEIKKDEFVFGLKNVPTSVMVSAIHT